MASTKIQFTWTTSWIVQ